eukprot:4719133-Pyramimonas_sp.AAC.1
MNKEKRKELPSVHFSYECAAVSNLALLDKQLRETIIVKRPFCVPPRCIPSRRSHVQLMNQSGPTSLQIGKGLTGGRSASCELRGLCASGIQRMAALFSKSHPEIPSRKAASEWKCVVGRSQNQVYQRLKC